MSNETTQDSKTSPFKNNEQYQGGLSIQVTSIQCFNGPQEPNTFLEGTSQFQFWFDIYKEGLENWCTSYIEVNLYRGDELIGSKIGNLTVHQLQKLSELQRKNNDSYGCGMIRTEEEMEEILWGPDNQETSVANNHLNLNNLDDKNEPSEEDPDDLPF